MSHTWYGFNVKSGWNNNIKPEISWDARSPPEVVRAIQPDTLIHPVIHDASGTQRFGVITATQWYLQNVRQANQRFKATYCPPAVGKADKNSASDAAIARLHIPAVSNPQMTLVEPPEGNARPSEDDSAVQEFKIANAKPSIDRRLWFR